MNLSPFQIVALLLVALAVGVGIGLWLRRATRLMDRLISEALAPLPGRTRDMSDSVVREQDWLADQPPDVSPHQRARLQLVRSAR
jgi:hypothetical protein